MTQPQPGQLNHDGAGLGSTGFADALIAAAGTALEMARRQSDIAPKLLAIVEMPVKDLADQCRANPLLLRPIVRRLTVSSISQRDEAASNFAALASAFAVAAANLAAAFCSAAMARSSAFCAVATFFVAAAWVFVKVATGFRTPRFTLLLAAGFFGILAISISNLAAILWSAVTNCESISAPVS